MLKIAFEELTLERGEVINILGMTVHTERGKGRAVITSLTGAQTDHRSLLGLFRVSHLNGKQLDFSTAQNIIKKISYITISYLTVVRPI